MSKRRGVYFAFQGLLMAVLLLLFFFHAYESPGWAWRFLLLSTAMTASLACIQLVPGRVLESWWLQMSLFVGDAFLASLTLHWTERNPDFFLIYLLIIFGTALTRSFLASLVVAAVTSLLYFLSVWHPSHGPAADTSFWLRLHLLWITTFLLGLLSRDTRQAQEDRQEHYRQRITQLESLATLGRVAGEVAHRIKGPLTTIRVNAEVLQHRTRVAGAGRELVEIQEEVDHCKAILKDLLDLGRIEEITPVRMDLRSPVRSALRSIRPQMKKMGIRFRQPDLSGPLWLEGDQSMLHEALLAVLQNAVDAAGPKGGVEVSVRTTREKNLWWTPPESRRLHVVEVADDGPGIDPRETERIFTPFYSTKGSEGSGLGLSAALRILQKHGGTIDAGSRREGRGAVFRLKLPAA